MTKTSWGEKTRENGIKKKSTKLSNFFRSFTFNNKDIKLICSLSFQFSILFTKHTWQEKICIFYP